MKRIGLALFLCLVAGLAVASEEDEFKNPTVGFYATKPAAWHFLTAQQNLENLKRTKLNDEEFKAAMLKYAQAPLFAIVKYPEPFDDVNPSFRVSVRPAGSLKGTDPKKLFEPFLAQMQRLYKDYKLIQPVSDVVVSGLRGAYARVDYTLEAPGVGSFPTTSELWIIPRGDFLFILGAGTRQDEKTGTRAQIRAILETVRIDP
jgi:hypothetical protein